MKKQFFRVKQLADQTFLRAEKSKQLSNELQEADHKVEYLRAALTAVDKRLPIYNSNAGQEKELLEKRMKKSFEYQLGIVMKEYGLRKDDSLESVIDDSNLLRPVLTKCGKTEIDLAREFAEHEIKVEQLVSYPLQSVLETDIPAIMKSKRTLSKLVLDMDSAINRYQTASKHGTKNEEALRDEMEEAELKVEQCRDNLATEMFSLLRRESDFAQYMLQLVKLQRAYHESALYTLEQLIPELEKEIGDSPVKAVYGCALEEHLRLSKRQIALPIELCVCALWELGMTEEGLFRVAGGTSRVRRMKLSLDSGCFSPPLQLEYRDVHVIASALKSYLRELPEPLLTYQLYEDWLRAAKQPTEEQRFVAINNVLSKLPAPNYDNIHYLMRFFSALSKNTSNRMTSSNIAIVIAPNLLWSVHDKSGTGLDMTNATIVNSLVEILVSHADRFFTGYWQVYHTFKRDDLFSDLTEFERPTIAHLRTSSNDTSFIQLDLDSKVDPNGSPKPFTRRKNKPAAPNPPNYETAPASSILNRKSMQKVSDNNTNGKNKMSVSVGTTDDNNQIAKKETETIRRKSLDFDPFMCISAAKNSTSVKKPDNIGTINKSDISSPINSETTNVNIDTLNIQQITAQNAVVGKIQISTENLQTKPVAAPRISLLENKSLSNQELDYEETVQLRKPREVPAKPLVPERPASLRMNCPKSVPTRFEQPLDSMLLERTHVYSVPDKQQVSIVPLAASGYHDSQMAEKEKFLMSTSIPSDFNSNLVQTQIGATANNSNNNNNNNSNNKNTSHHTRTLSDGDLIESVTSESSLNPPASPRGYARPPRPQLPPATPPPPPPTTSSQHATSAATTTTMPPKESTDL